MVKEELKKGEVKEEEEVDESTAWKGKSSSFFING